MILFNNDFVILDRRDNNIKITKELINKLSDRRTGAGCDQVITIDKNTSQDHDVNIKIFNPNGDKAEACGNGTRGVAYLLSKENNKNEIEVWTSSGNLKSKFACPD